MSLWGFTITPYFPFWNWITTHLVPWGPIIVALYAVRSSSKVARDGWAKAHEDALAREKLSREEAAKTRIEERRALFAFETTKQSIAEMKSAKIRLQDLKIAIAEANDVGDIQDCINIGNGILTQLRGQIDSRYLMPLRAVMLSASYVLDAEGASSHFRLIEYQISLLSLDISRTTAVVMLEDPSQSERQCEEESLRLIGKAAKELPKLGLKVSGNEIAIVET